MKYGSHENSCNGPGDCSCGQDYREYARRSIDRVREQKEELSEQDTQIIRLKAQVRYWKQKANKGANP